MPAAGQFWGHFSNATAQPAKPQPAPSAQFLLNIDMHRPTSSGCFIYDIEPANAPIPDGVKFALQVELSTNDGRRIIGRATTAATVDIQTGRIIPLDIPSRDSVPYQMDFAAIASVENLNFSGTWGNSWGEKGSVSFWRPESGDRVREVTKCRTWAEYKQWAGDEGRKNFAFRGQANSEWQLKTTLHRSDRFNLWTYSNETLPELQQEFEAAGASFNRENPTEFARLLALAQHHGFPTPLLDFTRSPYIAAYFAFSAVLDRPKIGEADHVRVYALDESFKAKASRPAVTLSSIEPTTGILGVSGLHNPRLYAQQGLFLFSNVELVEHLLTSQFYTQGATFLRAVDIPATVAAEAIKDLMYMGISPASLFPGIDGICLKLKQQLLTGAI
ncbi:FRG domain-containing protein [Paraburkholderia dipogonis]|uniref:FRG domain-containing protein n=1 Tax=Paraburkholderia dipogonis TaxID=1211383 RepID=UPI0038B976E4